MVFSGPIPGRENSAWKENFSKAIQVPFNLSPAVGQMEVSMLNVNRSAKDKGAVSTGEVLPKY